jgi:pilus assembly protein CpaF
VERVGERVAAVVLEVSGPERGEIVEKPLPCLIGRDPQCDLVLADPLVSRQHIRLTLLGDQLYGEDLKSANGTQLEGEPFREGVLPLGSTLRLGRHAIRISNLLLPGEESDREDRSLPFTRILQELRRRIREEGEELSGKDPGQMEVWIRSALKELVPEEEADSLFPRVRAELLGYGVIEPLLSDPEVDEIMVNGPRDIFIERKGRIERTSLSFEDDAAVMRVIERIVIPLGRRIDESSPMVDARLPDGSRVNAIIPPLALNGPVITIRKFKKQRLTIEDLIRLGSLTREMAELLEKAVRSRLNIVVSGGTGSGKTTLLNIISSFIPPEERIITIEDAAELQLHQPHVVRLETRPPNAEGAGEVRIRDLVRNALRMRPDRIVVGECRGGEALDMLQAMNTGHDGSLTTVHANSPRDALARIETMCLMADVALPHRAIREQVVRAIHLIVQQARFHDGKRRVVEIAEIHGLEGEVPVLQTLYRYDPVQGRHESTGFLPRFLTQGER